MDYQMKIAGLERALPLCPINENLYIGAFVIFGDVELTVACAKEIAERLPEIDVFITAESKGIPIAYELARQTGKPYVVARKSKKLYMRDVFTVEVKSITTAAVQILCLDGEKKKMLEGKRVAIIDDVISTGESLAALEELVRQAGGNITAKAAILAEGDAAERDDLIFLERLPLFNAKGEVIG